MNDFRNDEALMCAGLDDWFRSPPEPSLRIQEERLGARLRCDYFVKPPDFSDAEGGPKHKVPHVRFPLWHYCARCFRMKKAPTLFAGQPSCLEATCTRSQYGRRMIPVRIVAICENGHVEDFPFRAWIGCKCANDDVAQLFFKAGRSAASLAGVKIECQSCGAKRSLAGSFDENALNNLGIDCSGSQPWLGREKGQSCSQRLRTVQRGGSNVYFPAVQSSIYIPPARAIEPDDVRRVLDTQAFWDAISSGLVNGKINAVAGQTVAKISNVDAELLISAAQARIDGSRAFVVALTEEDFRRQEHKVLSEGSGSPTDDLFVERVDGARYGWLGAYFRRVGLVRKLRETRVLTGFSRLVPKLDRADPAVQPLSIRGDLGWLPAIEVRGEGIFVEINTDNIQHWSERSGLRVATLLREYGRRRSARNLASRQIDARFIMIHTLAHVLIKELTFTCGYGSASLRERLYCNLENPGAPMNGLLIYTASGDSEGTLGGLVAQAQPGRLERLVEEALRRSSWCSNDPVCMESPGEGALSSNLAACHGCVLLPETSCEEGNRLLDRATLIGTINDPSVGFFDGAPIA